MNKKDDIFDRFSQLDDNIAEDLAEKFSVPLTNAEISRISRKTARKLSGHVTDFVPSDSVSGTERVSGIRRQKIVPIAAAFVLIAALIPTMYMAMKRSPLKEEENDQRPLIVSTTAPAENDGAAATTLPVTETTNSNTTSVPQTTTTTVEHTTTSKVTTADTSVTETTTAPMQEGSECPEPSTTISVVTSTESTTTTTTTVTVPQPARKMTLDDVRQLAKKGKAITWNDLKVFEGTACNDSIFSMRFEVDEEYVLIGWDRDGDDHPQQLKFYSKKNTAPACDIRYGDLDGYLYTIKDASELFDMTLEEIYNLAHIGSDLTWSNLKCFKGVDVGSGLYIFQYEADYGYYLYAGGDIQQEKPIYVKLCFAINSEADGYYDMFSGSGDTAVRMAKDFVSKCGTAKFRRQEYISEGWLTENSPRLTYAKAKEIISGFEFPCELMIEALNEVCGAPDVEHIRPNCDRRYEYWLSDWRRDVIVIDMSSMTVRYYSNIHNPAVYEDLI